MTELNNYINSGEKEIKSALARLVKHRSVSGGQEGIYPFGKACGEVLDGFLDICREWGFSAVNYDYYAGSADINDKPARLGILGHLDVVPVSEGDWSFPPFECTEKEGRLYGRGCIDDKGPVIAALYAMKAIKDCGISLNHGVRLIVGCSEETGSEKDIEYYTEKSGMPPMVFTPDGDFPVITAEKGMIRISISGAFPAEGVVTSMSAGTVVNAVPGAAEAVFTGIDDKNLREAIPDRFKEKVALSRDGENVVLKVNGKAAHASTPDEGDNALTGLFSLLSILPLSEGEKEFFRTLSGLFPYNISDGKAMGVGGEDYSGALTCVFSMVQLKDGKFTGRCDIRYPVTFKKEDIIAGLQKKINESGLELNIDSANDPHSVDNDSPFVKTLLDVYHRQTGLEASGKAIGGGTYVHGIPGGVAFGMEFPGENNNMHGADEFVKIDSLIKACKIYAEAIIAADRL